MGLEWGPIICFSNNFLHNGHTVGLDCTLRTTKLSNQVTFRISQELCHESAVAVLYSESRCRILINSHVLINSCLCYPPLPCAIGFLWGKTMSYLSLYPVPLSWLYIAQLVNVYWIWIKEQIVEIAQACPFSSTTSLICTLCVFWTVALRFNLTQRKFKDITKNSSFKLGPTHTLFHFKYFFLNLVFITTLAFLLFTWVNCLTSL